MIFCVHSVRSLRCFVLRAQERRGSTAAGPARLPLTSESSRPNSFYGAEGDYLRPTPSTRPSKSPRPLPADPPYNPDDVPSMAPQTSSMSSYSSNHTPSRSRNILVAFSPSATTPIGVVATTHPAVTAYTDSPLYPRKGYTALCSSMPSMQLSYWHKHWSLDMHLPLTGEGSSTSMVPPGPIHYYVSSCLQCM